MVAQILDEMGIAGRPDDVLVGDGDAALSEHQYGRFIGAFSMRTGCMPYDLASTGGLSVHQFCARYVEESYPPPPTDTLTADLDHVFGSGPIRT
ncbi:MAG: hypothetical protein OES57_15220, partial [Acidimicrobiia bacterium]|nr:hypothetical protein [Acidimicrobiia bacterium]